MKNMNIGLVNLMISNKFKDSYFNNKFIEESKKLAFDFFDVIKKSPILQLEFKVFNNIENKHIADDLLATRYIDNNIKLFEIYTIQELNDEHNKLNQFIDENIIIDNYKKINLYSAIGELINESLQSYDNVDVDKIHESFTLVLEHIKTKKDDMLSEDIKHFTINDDVIEIAVDKFNSKYESLDESDRDLLKKLIKFNSTEKKELLESYKTENLLMLENITNEISKDKVSIAIKKIKEMAYKKDTIEDDIIGLYELKSSLREFI